MNSPIRFLMLSIVFLGLAACGSGGKIDVELIYVPDSKDMWSSVDGKLACAVNVKIENATKHRVAVLRIGQATFNDIGPGAVEEMAGWYVRDDPSCSVRTREKPSITRCEIDGMPEGDCLKLVNISS